MLYDRKQKHNIVFTAMHTCYKLYDRGNLFMVAAVKLTA